MNGGLHSRGIIKHDNILYVRDISVIGGVETWVYEMVKKYHDLDIAVVYKRADNTQLKRILKYCRAYKHTDQEIHAKMTIINYDSSICDFINKGKNGKIYMAVHADYSHEHYKAFPILDDRIDGYIGITEFICKTFEEKFGKKCELHYNPLEIMKPSKRLMLVSATRLSSIKGKDRMIALANALDKAGIDYVWYIFTNDTNAIPNEHIVYMSPRLDVYKWVAEADYLVQLSDTEGLSYAINEALYMNVAVIVTPLPYLNEIGVKHGKNAWIMQFDCSNVDEIAKNILNIPQFVFKKLKDGYEKLLVNSTSKYDYNKKTKTICKHRYFDIELQRLVPNEETNFMPLGRAVYLENNDFVQIV